MSSKPFRVGILGVAGISAKTCVAISSPESNCQVSAVASRSLEKANGFVKQYLSERTSDDVKVFGGSNAYDELIQSSNQIVDALYIPLPLAIKKQWVIKALYAGKHVVIEKPAALNATDYDEMLAAAQENKKFLLDGTMFPHHQRTREILDCVASTTSNSIGNVDRIEADFTFLASESFLDGSDIRARKDGDPHGCIGDLGWYCIRYALMVFESLGSKVLNAQVVDFELNKHGVCIDATCVIRFENKKALWFHCGFKTAFRQYFEICGSQKSIIVDDLVLPAKQPVSFTLKSSGLTDNALLTFHDIEIVPTDPGPVHEVLLWKTFQRIATSFDGDSDEFTKEATGWNNISLTNQKIIDALMESMDKECAPVTIL